MSIRGRNNQPYSYYGAPASILPMPLIALGSLFDGPSLGTSQFLFSFTSPILGALTVTVLFLIYIELGLELRNALFWTLIIAFTTLLWPISTSSFDNAQHAFFALTSVYLGFVSDKYGSNKLAACGGLLAAILVLYQEYFVLIVPVLALSSASWTARQAGARSASLWRLPWEAFRRQLDFLRLSFSTRGKERESLLRYVLWCATAIFAGLALSCFYNKLRFGSYFNDGKVQFSALHRYPIFGNPLTGLATLLLSPGKSVFLYSPPLFLCMFGIRHLRQRQPKMGIVIIVSTIVLVAFLSSIAFAGGDWCWGPRYLAVLIPLWALACPFVSLNRTVRGQLAIAVILVAGLLIQISAVSVENQRFFFERKLHDFFWAEDPWFYFKHSALFSRFGEVVSLRSGLPASAQNFNTVPMSDWCTYTILGPPTRMSREYSPIWMRSFKIFYLPRPWPLWMRDVDPASRPINLTAWVWCLVLMECIGILLVLPLARSRKYSTVGLDRVHKVQIV